MVRTEKFIPQAIGEIKKAAGTEKVVMALSGGVDSSVCAALAARAIGDQLIPIYIDTGLMRKGETERIKTVFSTSVSRRSMRAMSSLPPSPGSLIPRPSAR